MMGLKPPALACGMQFGDEGSSLHSSTFLIVNVYDREVQQDMRTAQ